MIRVISQFGSRGDFSEVPGIVLAVTIVLLVLGIVMQCFAIAYEKFHMDPMKRGLVNQLSTIFMAFSLCFSATCIIRYLLEGIVPQPMPDFIYQFIGWLGWVARASTFGCLITVNEVIFCIYWSKMWLKRVPNYDHDFLATWLSVANVIIAFYLGGLKTYNAIQWAKDEENVPSFRIFLILGSMMLLLVLVSVIHILIDCYKRRTSNSILPLYTVPIQEPPQPPPQPSALMLNTMKYNPDILNWKVALGTIFMVPILLFWYFVIQLKYAPLHLIINIVVCFYVPLLFCSLNPKLRSFIIKCFK